MDVQRIAVESQFPAFPWSAFLTGGAILYFALSRIDYRKLRVLGAIEEHDLEVLRHANADGATVLGMADRLGRIRRGMVADLLVVNGNPLYDITALSHVETVVKGGKVVR